MHTATEPIEQIYLSKKGHKDIKKELTELEREHKRVLLEIRELDKTDNHDQRLLRSDKLIVLDTLEQEMSEKRAILSKARLLPRKRDSLKVAIGSVVELIDIQGKLVRYTIVDSLEANPSDGRISASSPLGSRLIGKQMKDIVEWSVGLRQNRLTLVGIA